MNKICYITAEQFNFLQEQGVVNTDDKLSFNKLHKRLIKEIGDREHVENVLLERGGVAVSPYMPTIESIISFVEDIIRNYPKNSPNNDGWILSIPTEVTKGIDFIDNLDLTVFVYDDKSGKYNTGSGRTLISKEPLQDITVDNKWKTAKITIYAFAYKKRLYRRTFSLSLIHELNHKYEELQCYLHNSVENFVLNGKYFTQDIKSITFSNDKDTDTFIKDVLYRLFTPTEMNAFASGVYGELLGMGISRDDFIKNKDSVISFWYYFQLKQQFENLDTNKVDWPTLLKFFQQAKYPSYKGKNNKISYIKDFSNTNDIKVFANRFIKQVAKRLNKLYTKMEQAANTYFSYADDRSFIKEYFDYLDNGPIEHVDLPICQLAPRQLPPPKGGGL